MFKIAPLVLSLTPLLVPLTIQGQTAGISTPVDRFVLCPEGERRSPWVHADNCAGPKVIGWPLFWLDDTPDNPTPHAFPVDKCPSDPASCNPAAAYWWIGPTGSKESLEAVTKNPFKLDVGLLGTVNSTNVSVISLTVSRIASLFRYVELAWRLGAVRQPVAPILRLSGSIGGSQDAGECQSLPVGVVSLQDQTWTIESSCTPGIPGSSIQNLLSAAADPKSTLFTWTLVDTPQQNARYGQAQRAGVATWSIFPYELAVFPRQVPHVDPRRSLQPSRITQAKFVASLDMYYKMPDAPAPGIQESGIEVLARVRALEVALEETRRRQYLWVLFSVFLALAIPPTARFAKRNVLSRNKGQPTGDSPPALSSSAPIVTTGDLAEATRTDVHFAVSQQSDRREYERKPMPAKDREQMRAIYERIDERISERISAESTLLARRVDNIRSQSSESFNDLVRRIYTLEHPPQISRLPDVALREFTSIVDRRIEVERTKWTNEWVAGLLGLPPEEAIQKPLAIQSVTPPVLPDKSARIVEMLLEVSTIAYRILRASIAGSPDPFNLNGVLASSLRGVGLDACWQRLSDDLNRVEAVVYCERPLWLWWLGKFPKNSVPDLIELTKRRWPHSPETLDGAIDLARRWLDERVPAIQTFIEAAPLELGGAVSSGGDSSGLRRALVAVANSYGFIHDPDGETVEWIMARDFMSNHLHNLVKEAYKSAQAEYYEMRLYRDSLNSKNAVAFLKEERGAYAYDFSAQLVQCGLAVTHGTVVRVSKPITRVFTAPQGSKWSGSFYYVEIPK